MARKDILKESQKSEKVMETIKKKAYEIYEKNGRKTGRDLNNWLEAEAIVLKSER